MYGDTEKKMEQELRESGMMGPSTTVNIDPNLT